MKHLRIVLGVLLLLAILFDLHFFIPSFEYRYSVIKKAVCNVHSGKDYLPIQMPVISDQVGGYECVTPEEYAAELDW